MKKFTAFIAFNDEFRNLYYDTSENLGIFSTWDVYHIQENTERPSQKELEIMEGIFNTRILKNDTLLKDYLKADFEFRNNISKKIRRE